MKRYNRSFTLLCLLLVTGFSSNASAGLVTEILGLDIGGTDYDVTFHGTSSFNDLWDQDADGTFGGGTSMFNAMPMFWLDPLGAAAAQIAIINYFPADGSDGTSIVFSQCGLGCLSDGFGIPTLYASSLSTVQIFADGRPNLALIDFPVISTLARSQSGLSSPFVSFSLSAAPIPEPASIALMGLGLAGVGWSRRKRTQ